MLRKRSTLLRLLDNKMTLLYDDAMLAIAFIKEGKIVRDPTDLLHLYLISCQACVKKDQLYFVF